MMIKLPFWHPAVDPCVCPLLFSRPNACVWRPGILLNKQPEQAIRENDDNVENDAAATPTEAAVDWEAEPYEDEDPACDMIDDSDDNSDGEGEGLLLEEEPEYAAHLRKEFFEQREQLHSIKLTAEEKKDRFVSQAMALRYMLQIRPPRYAGDDKRNRWHDPHWINQFGRLFEYFVCLYNNKVEREKFQWIKRKQENLRCAVSQDLVDGLERQRRRQNGDFKYLQISFIFNYKNSYSTKS
jgi:hypothetical protein